MVQVSPIITGVILTFVPYIFIIHIMNQQLHNWSTVYYTC